MDETFLTSEEIQGMFKSHLKIESKVMSIDTLFSSKRRQNNTNYAPYYQRNYVWDRHKATYFIESVLLGTEIPPLVFFNTGKNIEVIDGRQRFETIKKFIENGIALSRNGLSRLHSLRNMKYEDIEKKHSEIMDLFWDTKLRIIEFSVISDPGLDELKEDRIKKEIFRRYNSGITPLKNTEIESAIYIYDDLTTYIKDKLRQNEAQILSKFTELFFPDIDLHRKSNLIEKVMTKIRFFLVFHQIPVRNYGHGIRNTSARLFDILSGSEQNISCIYNGFPD